MALDGENRLRSGKGRRLRSWLLSIWLVLVAGLPVYYLRPDCDWDYRRWGTPEAILESARSPENHLHGDEGVYTRVFVVQPSEGNRECLALDKCRERELSPFIASCLRRYNLPGPYRSGGWLEYGWVDLVLCGNGQLLMCDYSRNKGGLLSAKFSYCSLDYVWTHYPAHVGFFYCWAIIAVLALLLAPFLVWFARIRR